MKHFFLIIGVFFLAMTVSAPRVFGAVILDNSVTGTVYSDGGSAGTGLMGCYATGATSTWGSTTCNNGTLPTNIPLSSIKHVRVFSDPASVAVPNQYALFNQIGIDGCQAFFVGTAVGGGVYDFDTSACAGSSSNFAGLRFGHTGAGTDQFSLMGNPVNVGSVWKSDNTQVGTGSFAYQLCDAGGCSGGFQSTTTTRFISITPATASTTATTTTIGAEVYINPDDFESGTYLSMSFTSQTLSLTGGSALDAFNSATGRGEDIQLPLVSGYNNVSTTTTFLMAGRTNGNWKVISPSFLGTLPVVGFLFPTNNLIATSSYFYYLFKTGLDDSVDLGADSVAEYILTGTTTGANTILNCSNLLSGGLTPCIVSLFVPNATTLSADFTRLRDGFLSTWPLGYLTRFIGIFLSSATSTIPTFSATIPSGVVGAGSHISLDLNGALNPILNATSSTFVSAEATSTQTFYQITSRYWDIFVYLALAFYILRRLLGSKVVPHLHHKKQ